MVAGHEAVAVSVDGFHVVASAAQAPPDGSSAARKGCDAVEPGGLESRMLTRTSLVATPLGMVSR